ncbi:effector-associated constant component EACC1 [Saccharopolyspora sp. CA-218241]|uniref:effector-associated constant component EACC1 n=1 Tax=Saccharopolyspora sp. CA-218241 TaxID=3240027 RepID=UPI003D96F254
MNRISIEVSEAGSDGEELDRLTRRLRADLLALDVEDVAIPDGPPAPEGAKGAATELGTLVVTLANSTVLIAVCQLARMWVQTNKNRKVLIKDGERSIELVASSQEQHDRIIDGLLKAREAEAVERD